MGGAGIRIDKWLWFARFFKSRTLAGKRCAAGRVRINGVPIAKSHQTVQPGDILTFPQGHDIRVVEILETGTRRGPASEAQTLYKDLEPPQKRSANAHAKPSSALREPGAGRPTKADRRAIDRLKGNP
ncbi:MAG: RNA-binding S4 domain-containing protein [Rhodospirillales bacterium]|nr:RNA-binding S4 domain-containing protein [Rhodospirillales bacterium]